MTTFVEIPTLRGIHEIRNLFNIVHRRGIICGGYARYCASGHDNPVKSSDLDIYCFREEHYDSMLLDFKAAGWATVRDSKFAISLLPPTGDDLQFDLASKPFTYNGPEVQLIKPMREGKVVAYGTTEEILDNFDFTVTRAALLDENTALVDQDFIRDDAKMQLVIKNIHCPISSSLRVAKYVKKGFKISSVEVYKLFVDWDNRSLEYKQSLHQTFKEIAMLLVRMNDDDIGWKERGKLAQDVKSHLQSLYEVLNVD